MTFRSLLASLACACWLALLSACQRPPNEAELRAVVTEQVAVAHSAYQQSLASAKTLDEATADLVAAPSAESLAQARDAWLAAHARYSRTETLRFGHGLVDERETRINAWPVDEGLLDYVDASYAAAADNPAARANIVASERLEFAGITADTQQISIGTLRYMNELLGIESNVLRGFHPIEFLLWGQDLSVSGPGGRPLTDYMADAHCTSGPRSAPAEHCRKRGQLLRAASQLLVQDLIELDAEWNPDQGSYARRLLQGDPREGLRRMLFGMAALARDELAGQRIEAGLLSGGQEEEQNCFSDSTPSAHTGNAAGIAALYFGRAATGEAAPHSLASLLQRRKPNLDRRLRAAFGATEVALTKVLEAGLPYDQMLRPGHPEGRQLLKGAVRALQAEAALLEEAGASLGLGSLNPAARSADLAQAAKDAAAATASDEARPGGATTVQPRTTAMSASRDALSQPAANLSLEARAKFMVGNSFFTNAWVAAPASTGARDGLGPLYNAAACQNCHIKDGRGHPPETPGAAAVSFLVKLGRAPQSAAETQQAAQSGRVFEPVYGGQIQDRATPGVPPEAQVKIVWQSQTYTYPDGQQVQLRAPELRLEDLAYGPLADGIAVSARIAPPMTGLGLLEAIPEADLLAAEDPDDRNGDGLSGRINRVWSAELKGPAIGRFGWKAGTPSVRQQTALAANGDMGLRSAPFPQDDCRPAQSACSQNAGSHSDELSAEVLDAISFYARHLAVPARRWIDPPEVRAGEQHFRQLGCAGCHRPAWRTGAGKGVDPALADQPIRPYTDLMLHDMGPELDDGVPEFAATGTEWRTPPLWGLHLAQRINPHAGFLHDGRARTLEEAVLWHGGEAAAPRQGFTVLNTQQRGELIWFLKSL